MNYSFLIVLAVIWAIVTTVGMVAASRERKFWMDEGEPQGEGGADK